MKSIRASFVLRATIVITMMFAWIVISNHCALTQLVAKASSCCHPEPSKNVVPMKCCKALHATIPDTAPTTDATFHAELFVIACAEIVVSPERAIPVDATVHFRPPDRAVGFPDLVLGQSLRSHAPPSLA